MSGPAISGIRLEDTEIDSEIKIVDEDTGDETTEDVRSSFFILNPQVQGWKTYYYIENIFEQFPDVAPETEKEIPVVLNDKVIHYMVYFQNQGRRSFSIWLERSGKFIPLMKEILSQRGMPTDLVYLAMIESGFNVKAESRSAAVGPWQFIKPTALRYGLRVDSWVDERMDPRKSTNAAADYLSDLYAMFQSWELAAAGYNCGEDRVQAAIDKYQINDFWQISEFTLPTETKNYVPKLMAALIIAKSPDKYGFVGIDYHEAEFYETVMVPPQKSLNDIARVIGVSHYTLVELNPAILLNATPPGGPYQINVPQGYSTIASQKSKELYALKDVNPVIAQRSVGGTHKVRRGETLGRIAARYGVSVSSIKRANGMRSSTIRTGQVLTIPGLSGPSSSYASNDGGGTTVEYRVRRGDTLGAIAARHRVSIASIKNANNLRSSMIRSGQVLTIPGATGRYYDTDVVTTSSTRIAKHMVNPGETLGGIAAKYNVSISTIKRANGIKGSTIMSGQVLDIPYITDGSTYIASSEGRYDDSSVTSTAAASRTSTTRSSTRYTVKSGDTLGKIAAKHGVSTASIQSANNMRGTVVKRGEVLTIPGTSSTASTGTEVSERERYNGAGSKYTVARGDTLGSISRKFGVSVASIQSANNLNGSVIKYGQVLTIPGTSSASYSSASVETASVATSKYRVQPGDTLGGIAEKHGVALSSLKSANNLNGSVIRSGQVLVIPNGSYASSKSFSSSSDVISYRVKKGDTLWEIASRHNVSVASIQKWNNLRSAELTPGVSLTIYK
ncbi:MAG: LysM peptidoglycan-binding domain-containing protein [Thermodesulfobacteriota bacterium]